MHHLDGSCVCVGIFLKLLRSPTTWTWGGGPVRHGDGALGWRRSRGVDGRHLDRVGGELPVDLLRAVGSLTLHLVAYDRGRRPRCVRGGW